ncbi:ABC transporter ATP-binding protein [Streptosporangium amethystogenes]|uniref:ABC transporter ATP-binding protein n=1 Tax=Streptosporangium amethystogenes TaxID=2002 RepID=UPI00068E84C0|nr:ABC transporter ATP-binding protein [Streptosporangium amethystogenes]
MLEVKDLVVTAGDVRIVDGVSFEVRPGEVLGMVGESGSGKTMTMLAVAGLLSGPARVAGGTAVLDGTELTAARLERLRGRRIGFVFQDPATSLNPLMRVGTQISEVLRIHGVSRSEARRRAAELLEQVDLGPERAGRYPHELSGGQRQRIVIAMAIALRPSLLIADEPTTALDVTVQEQVMRVLRTAQRETGAATVLVSHDLGLVAEAAHRIAVMYAGRLVETGTVQEVLGTPRHPYSAALMRSRPRVGTGRGPLPVIPGYPPAPKSRPPGCAFHPRCPVTLDRCAKETPPLVGGVACWAVRDD